jgi:hypothetical protein
MGLVLAAALLVAGSFLDWVTIARVPQVIPSDQASRAQPFNGFDVGDGYVTSGAGIVLACCAVMLTLKRKSSIAWVAFLATMVAGGIAISDYRGIQGVFDDRGGIGVGIHPGIGLTLIASAVLVSLVSSVTGIAASPSTR